LGQGGFEDHPAACWVGLTPGSLTDKCRQQEKVARQARLERRAKHVPHAAGVVGLPGRGEVTHRGQLGGNGSMALAVKNPLPLRASDATDGVAGTPHLTTTTGKKLDGYGTRRDRRCSRPTRRREYRQLGRAATRQGYRARASFSWRFTNAL
jgi:hypothetical protein